MSELKRKFLIRSSGEILGPYSKEEVTTLIKKGKISVFDEVTEPYKVWMYLENHKDLKKIVQSMNVQTRLTNFLTQVSHRISISKKKPDNTSTQTIEGEETLSQTTKDIPQEVSFNLAPETTQTSVKTQLKTAKKMPVRTVPSPFELKKQKEEKLKKKIGFVVRLTWTLVILSSFLVSGIILYRISYVPIKKKKELVTELNSQGKKYYKVGDFKKALPFFSKAQDYLTQEEMFSFAILLLQNNQMEQFYLIKEKIKDQAILEKENWTLLEGLSAFYSQRYSEAIKSFHSVILKKDNKQTFNLALLNLTLLKLESRQYNELINEIHQLLKQSFERDIIWYLKAIYFLTQEKISELESFLLKDLGLGKPNQTFVVEFKQELLFLLAYTYMRTGRIEARDETIKRLLNQDPFFIEEYGYNLLIAKKKLNWSFLYPYCNEIFKSNPEENLLQALYSFCFIKTNQIKQAKFYIEKAKNREPENSLFLSLYIYMLMAEKENTKKIEQVFSLINYDSKSTRENNLPFIIKARFFEQAEYWDSALLVWKDLIRQDLNHISGLAGISFNSYQVGETTTGNFYRKKVLDRYPHHIKVLPYE